MAAKKKTAYALLLAGLVALTGYGLTHQDGTSKFGVGDRLVCLLTTVLSAVGMEFYARSAHRSSWHGGLWFIHATHHTRKSEKDLYELNDVFGVLNVVVICPIMGWAWFAQPSLGVSALLGFTIGVSTFGTAYIVVHDGMHHRRFPVGFLDSIGWLKEIADAHGEHHKADMGPPFGMFLGPAELRAAKSGQAPAPIPSWLKWGLVSSGLATSAALLTGV